MKFSNAEFWYKVDEAATSIKQKLATHEWQAEVGKDGKFYVFNVQDGQHKKVMELLGCDTVTVIVEGQAVDMQVECYGHRPMGGRSELLLRLKEIDVEPLS